MDHLITNERLMRSKAIQFVAGKICQTINGFKCLASSLPCFSKKKKKKSKTKIEGAHTLHCWVVCKLFTILRWLMLQVVRNVMGQGHLQIKIQLQRGVRRSNSSKCGPHHPRWWWLGMYVCTQWLKQYSLGLQHPPDFTLL